LSRLGHLSANRNQKPMLVRDVEQVKRPKSIIPTLVRGYYKKGEPPALPGWQ
jgi:mannitol-1-phosphate/altronate dehydrogenase